MTISIEEAKYIAHLARLELSEAELLKYRQELAIILAYIDRLNEVDIGDIEPFRQIFESPAGLRADTIEVSLPRKDALRNAPFVMEGMFNVPKVI